MGYGSRANNVLLVLAALEQLLAEQNYRFAAGAAVAAATAAYASAKTSGANSTGATSGRPKAAGAAPAVPAKA